MAVSTQGSVKQTEFPFGYVKVEAMHDEKHIVHMPGSHFLTHTKGIQVGWCNFSRGKIAAVFGCFLGGYAGRCVCFSFFSVSQAA